jgi:hypothetical protein
MKIKKRIWIPKKRAEKFEDKRTKRQKTRQAKFQKIIKEYA